MNKQTNKIVSMAIQALHFTCQVIISNILGIKNYHDEDVHGNLHTFHKHPN